MPSVAESAATVENEHYQRLLQGMAKAVYSKGYGATTIADIVAEAAVSRRTFYEHFATKAECLIALYESVSLEGLSVLSSHINSALPWREQVQDALSAYFGWMTSNPALMRALFVDILALGPEGLTARRRVHDQIAQFILRTANAADTENRDASPITLELSVALVGGIHELVLQQSEKGELSSLGDLAKIGAEFVGRVIAHDGHARSGLS